MGRRLSIGVILCFEAGFIVVRWLECIFLESVVEDVAIHRIETYGPHTVVIVSRARKHVQLIPTDDEGIL